MFLILPAAGAFIFIWYGLMPGYYRNIPLHRLSISDHRIVIETHWQTINEDGTTAACKVRTTSIPISQLYPPQQLAGGLLWLQRDGRGLLWAPFSSLPASENAHTHYAETLP